MLDYYRRTQSQFKIFCLCFCNIIYACKAEMNHGDTLGDDMGIYEMGTTLDVSINSDVMNHHPPLSLVQGDLWSIADPTIDPFIHHLLAERIACGRSAYGEEYSAVEVNTGKCDYITLTQHLPHQIKSGDRLHVIAWHNPLYIPQISEAHIALSLGSDMLWQKDIVLPSGAQHWDEVITSPIYADIGTPIFVHIRNHGNNTWTFYDLQLYQN